MLVAEPRHAFEHVAAGRGGPAAHCVDVQEHLLCGCNRFRLAVTQQDVEDVQPLLVGGEHLGRHGDRVARPELAEVGEVRLDSEVAPAGGEIVRVDPDRGEERVRRVAEDLQIPALVDVAVVVDPVRRDVRRVQPERTGLM